MQRGSVYHFDDRNAPENLPVPPPPKLAPWLKPGWARIHAKHLAHWSSGSSQVWPSCRAESKRKALAAIRQQLMEYPELGRPVWAQGAADARVLVLLKSPSRMEVRYPGTVTNSTVFRTVRDGIGGGPGAKIMVLHVFPFHKGVLWPDADVPVSAAQAFELYLKAAVRILSPKVILCPGRYLAQYARSGFRPKNICDVPDTPMNEFVAVSINRVKTHLLRIPHPFQASERCQSSLQERMEFTGLINTGLKMAKQLVTVSDKPLNALKLLMHGTKVPLEMHGATQFNQMRLPGIDEPGHFEWILPGKLATMDKPVNKTQVTRLCMHKNIRVVVNLSPQAHPKSWFKGIQCREVHCAFPDDGGAPSVADGKQAIAAVEKSLILGRAVVVHRTYGPGATGFFVSLLKARRGGQQVYKSVTDWRGPTKVQTEFANSLRDSISSSSSSSSSSDTTVAKPGIEAEDPIEEFPPRLAALAGKKRRRPGHTPVDDRGREAARRPGKKRRKARRHCHYVVWLMDERGRHYKLDQVFDSMDKAGKFTRRGNRELKRTSKKRAMLRETQGLWENTCLRSPRLYCLRSDDIEVNELVDTKTSACRRRWYGEPPAGAASPPRSGEIRTRARRDSENLQVDREQWNQYVQGSIGRL